MIKKIKEILESEASVFFIIVIMFMLLYGFIVIIKNLNYCLS